MGLLRGPLALLPLLWMEAAVPDTGVPAVPSAAAYVETGDLPALKKRGRLRFLAPRRQEDATLPRGGTLPGFERDLAERFARRLGLEPVWVYVEGYGDLIPALSAGKGDVIAVPLTVTKARKERVAFSVPLATVREQVVVRAAERRIRKLAGLAGRTLVVRRSSSYWQTAQALRRRVPSLRVAAAPEHLDTEQILHRVATGRYDITLADSNLVAAVLDYRSDLKAAFDASSKRPVAWAVRPRAKELRKALDRFLNETRLSVHRAAVYREDLPGIKKRGVLRVLTRNNAATYFLWRGELMGFEYELAREFAKRHGLRLEIVVPPSHEDLIPWLLEGKGDVVAAALTATDERRALGVAFSRPYQYVAQMLVARKDDTGLKRPRDLAGRTVVVRRSSAYWPTLERLQASGIPVKLEAAPEVLETEEIIARVAEGKYDLTVADSHILAIEETWRDDIRGAFPLTEKVALGWAVRKEDRKLLAAINRFFKKEYRGLFYNLTYRKYFRDPRKIRHHAEWRVDRSGRFSPYDDLARKYASRYGFDWRLIVSQMYQESRFDPKARSWAGALGLMQLLPRTARQFGFTDLHDPETSIHAGVRYLAWVRDRFDPELSVQDRTWFALAAYNAGYGHVLDARRIAARKGWDRNRWFGHVERAIKLLSRPEYYKHARFGYCRGSEPARYVREIRDRYRAYVAAGGK